MKKIQLSKDVDIGLDVVTRRIAWLGTIGTGKTYAAMRLAECIYDSGAHFVAIDPVGVWSGLRSDGTGRGLDVVIFGGLCADVPIRPTDGSLIADVICESRTCAVIDVSQFESDSAKARFASDWAERFYFLKKASPSAVHIFLEECQEFVPQNPSRDEATMLNRFVRMSKIGRNYGIGVSLISQRPQEINKKALNISEAIFAFRLTGPHERKAVSEWASSKGLETAGLAQELPSLERGKPHLWSPEWLGVSKVVEISAKRTHDSSRTPEVGVASKAARLRKIDVDAIRTRLAKIVSETEAEDPKRLRARIKELEREVAKKPASVIDPRTIEREVERAMRDKVVMIDKYDVKLASVTAALREIATQVDNFIAQAAVAPLAPKVSDEPPPNPAPKVKRIIVDDKVIYDADVSKPQKKILDTLADLGNMGIEKPLRSTVGIFSDQSPTSSSYQKNISTLRTQGLVMYPCAKTIRLTESGLALADIPGEMQTRRDLHDGWIKRLSGPQGRVMRLLIESYPTPLARTYVAVNTDQSPTSSSYQKNLSSLKSLGLVSYPTHATVVATDILFPEGLK